MKICLNRREESLQERDKKAREGPHFPAHAHPTHLRLLWEDGNFFVEQRQQRADRARKEAWS